VLHLLAALPRRNEWVFSSPTSATGCLTEPNNSHTRACVAAGLGGLEQTSVTFDATAAPGRLRVVNHH